MGDVGGRGMAPSSQRLAAGDTVKVELEIAILRMMQEDHGGWNDNMSSVSQCVTCDRRTQQLV